MKHALQNLRKSTVFIVASLIHYKTNNTGLPHALNLNKDKNGAPQKRSGQDQ